MSNLSAFRMSPQAHRILLRRRSLVTAVAGLGLCLSLASFDISRQNQQKTLYTEFSHQAENHSALVREVVLSFESALFGLRNVFIGSVRVSPNEFAIASKEILQRYPGITLLEWIPIVKGSERAKVEQEVSKRTGREFHFVTNEGTIAPESDEYMPILYLEPLEGNERAFGYDVHHAPTAQTIARARASGKMAVSPRFRLVQETEPNRYSVVFVWPILDNNDPSRVLGFVQAVIRLAGMLQRPKSGFATFEPLDILYLDPEAAPGQRMLYSTEDFSPNSRQTLEQIFRQGMHREVRIPVGDRHWIVLYRPDREWMSASRTSTPEWLLLGGLTITGLIAGIVYILGRRAEVIGNEVERQTVELKESRRQLESLMQSLPGMVFRFGYESDRQTLFLSNGAERLTGYAVAELAAGNPHPRKLIHPEDLPRVRAKTGESLATKRPFEMEYRILTRDGEERWVLSRGQGVYTPEGELRFIEGLVIDISIQKLAESQKLLIERRMQESQKRESLGLLAGGVAHDFNNLLTTILGNASVAKLELPPNSRSIENLSQIQHAARHAALLCRQMLAYAGKGQLRKEDVDLPRVIKDMLPLLHSSVGNAVELIFNSEENTPAIHGDPAEISQIVMNLVINAGEAMAEAGGKVAITTYTAEVDSRQLQQCIAGNDLSAGRYLALEVTDNGNGIDADVLKRIFDPFFSTKFEGRGLGLAAVIGIVRGHKAAIQVKSIRGQGTTFTIFFPISGSTDAATNTPTALIVDDDEPVREVTCELFRTLGFEAEHAADGPEAIDKVRARPSRYTVVLLDCVMPGLSGEETLRELQKIRPGLPVILMSGNNERGVKASDTPFLVKPFSRSMLEKALQAAMPASQGQSPA